jgi:hypothetical protein
MDYLEKKTNKDYLKEVKQVFNKLTITGNYRVIGSASFKKIQYNSDFDLEELIKNQKGKTILEKIYHIFKKKFEDAKKDKNYFITDFKRGLNTDGEPLRWSYSDIKKGYKILESGRKMPFTDCILIKSTIKLDMIVLIDGIFTEFSENYYFKIGDEANFFNHELDPEHIEMGIKKSLDEYLNVDLNYWKSLKRIFSLEVRKKKRNMKLIKKMIDFFNGNTGLINKCKNELEIILIVLDNEFRKPKRTDIDNNLNEINKWAQEAGINININNIINKKTSGSLYKSIEKLKDKLFDLVNKSSYIFLKKNLSKL